MSVLFADDALLFYFLYHAFQAKRVTEIHTSKLTYGSTTFTSKPATGHNPEPGPSTCHLNNLCLNIHLTLWQQNSKVQHRQCQSQPVDTILNHCHPPVTTTTYVSKIQLMLWQQNPNFQHRQCQSLPVGTILNHCHPPVTTTTYVSTIQLTLW